MATLTNGVLLSADVHLIEKPRKTLYETSLAIMPGTVVWDILLVTLSAWASTGLNLMVTDNEHPLAGGINGAHINQVGFENLAVYDPAAPDVGRNFEAMNDAAHAFYGAGALSFTSDGNTANGGPGVHYAEADKLAVTLAVAHPAAAPTGKSLLKIIYFPPGSPLAVKAT